VNRIKWSLREDRLIKGNELIYLYVRCDRVRVSTNLMCYALFGCVGIRLRRTGYATGLPRLFDGHEPGL